MTDDKTVQVALRIRPLVQTEISQGSKNVLEVFSDINQIKIRNTEKAFTYNYVFGHDADQGDIYERAVKHMIQNIFNGYNLTILAYGQTGSGKTHTMGTAYSGEGDMGVIPRAVTEIFSYIKDNFSYDFTVTVSFMELYQEVLYDLLSDRPREQCILDIREDSAKNILIPGLTEVPVECTRDVFEALTKGSRGRATGATNMNAQSSRSHAIFTINLSMQHKTERNLKTAKFHLVDLAGSERPKKTGAVGTTFKEGVNINKGLLVLGNVISALGDEKQHGYIPYRDSNLTRLLKDSLGGNSITLMIACVSPADYNVEETISTLRYADRARKIQNKPVVNQDPKAAEINKLKKTIQELKLQIVGQGGPVICPGEIEVLKVENQDLRLKIRDLTIQLSSTLNDNTGLLERMMILQNANETLHKKIQELKNEYDVTLGNISLGIDQNNQETIKDGVAKLQLLQKQFDVIDNEQKRTEKEILHHEQIIDLHSSQNGQIQSEEEMTKDQENYTNKQMALNVELQEITKKLAMKEHLARQIATNTQHLVDYKALAENEDKILTLQKEKDELMQQLKAAGHQAPSGKISEQRRKRVQELETQIQELNRKVQEQARLIKLKEKDVMKINQLNNDILQMKQTRVKLIRKMREESDRFRTWKMQRERELAKLKQQDRKKQNQIVKMEAMHSKQQNVLKRKVEEAVALNKRLKDALALRKATQDSKNSGKIDRIGVWIKQEFDVHVHLVEAEATLTGLLEDRATLQEQLDKLKENSEGVDQSAQIQAIEEDIELRSVQIQDLQQKILDSEEDNKKSKFDNIQTMGEAKFALKIVLEQASEIKKNEVMMKAKLIEAQAYQNECKHKIDNLEKSIKLLEYQHADEASHLQKQYEEKVAVLLRQLRGIELRDANEELKQRSAIQSEKIDELEKSNQELMAKLFEYQQQTDELKQKLDTITMAREAEVKLDSNDFKTPTETIKSKKFKIKKDVDSTFVIENQENVDLSFEDDVDDIAKDPDWKNTPLGKWILDKKRKTSHKNSSESSIDDVSTRPSLKRTSEGGCMCLRGNCTRRCGCRKLNIACSTGCKCLNTKCTNRNNENLQESLEETNTNSVEEKKPRLIKQKLFLMNNSSEKSD